MLKALSQSPSSRRFAQRVSAMVRHRDHLFGPCPFCGVGLGAHPFRDLAFAEAPCTDSALASLQHAIAARDWRAVSSFAQARATDDALVVHAIKCSRSSRAVVFTLESRFELFANDRVLTREALTPEETTALETVVVFPWYTPEDTVRHINAAR